MDWHDFKYKVKDTLERLGGNDPARTKLIVVCTAAGISFLIFLIVVVPLLIPSHRARELNTAGWRTVRTLNESLIAEPDFADTNFIVETESPLTLKVVGAVHTDDAMAKLLAKLKELRPQEDYTVNVEILMPDAKKK